MFFSNKNWDLRCEKCNADLGKGKNIMWLKNYTRNELYCYCEDCGEKYCDMIRKNGGSAVVESERCRSCGGEITHDDDDHH